MKRILTALVAASLAATVLAAQVGRAEGHGGARLLLSDQTGDCRDGLQMVAFVNPAGGIVPGCWFARAGFVWIVFADGDTLGLPQRLFKFEDV